MSARRINAIKEARELLSSTDQLDYENYSRCQQARKQLYDSLIYNIGTSYIEFDIEEFKQCKNI